MSPLEAKMSIVAAAEMIAVTEVVNGLTDSANKVGTLGMQGLLALMLIILGYVIFHLERKRSQDRIERDKQLQSQYDNLLRHHENFASKAEEERSLYHAESKHNTNELKGLTERSIVAMHAIANSNDALRQYIKERPEQPALTISQVKELLLDHDTLRALADKKS